MGLPLLPYLLLSGAQPPTVDKQKVPYAASLDGVHMDGFFKGFTCLSFPDKQEERGSVVTPPILHLSIGLRNICNQTRCH